MSEAVSTQSMPETALRLPCAAAAQMTFKACADEFLSSRSAEWKNEKHRNQWRNTLTDYAYPYWEIFRSLASSPTTSMGLEIDLERQERDGLTSRGRVEAILACRKSKAQDRTQPTGVSPYIPPLQMSNIGF